ncbi:class I SAM-dependent methyltransferase [Actinokineospora iranica]|uniref:Methyltransferase domain-containing protein n=1 Tax=Actinokineospora iranica TaxID=1271860 RepID=A0A1G6K5P5_9PSEU|nr:class I SAM-dependent methyltransferase [Actinokineospora iranica]SDC26198.1 Methyltransferase domain-containing protein [Actinokineospora iranica]
MDTARTTVGSEPADQTALWNGVAGQAWVQAQDLLDQMFTPFENLLVDAVLAQSPTAVLDIGCGTGGLTTAVARALGARSRCVGVDISEPMIGAARARADRENTRAAFVRADAQTHAFPPGDAEMIISRFGVMFFDDPVEAFANLRRAAADGAGLRFIAWRGAGENPFMTTAERAAAPLLPNLPARNPDAPGQFAFADADRVRGVLAESDWADIDIAPLDVVCALPEPDLVRYLTLLGPVGRALHDADERTRALVIDTARAAFAPFAHGTEVRFTAACWLVSATASPA